MRGVIVSILRTNAYSPAAEEATSRRSPSSS